MSQIKKLRLKQRPPPPKLPPPRLPQPPRWPRREPRPQTARMPKQPPRQLWSPRRRKQRPRQMKMRERNRKPKMAAGPKPERTCIACMKRDSKSAMIRIAVVNGKVEADFAARQPGRGGYLHPTLE